MHPPAAGSEHCRRSTHLSRLSQRERVLDGGHADLAAMSHWRRTLLRHNCGWLKTRVTRLSKLMWLYGR